MYLPQVKSATVRRRYRLGAYEGRLFSEIESIGPIQYRYVFLVFKAGERSPCFCVTSETSEMPPSLGPCLPILGVFDGGGHITVSFSEAWADIEQFTEQALTMTCQRFELTIPPNFVPELDG